MQQVSGIQHLLVRLITCPPALDAALRAPKQFLASHGVKQEISEGFVEFVDKYGQNFWVSARLLLKRRKEAIFEALDPACDMLDSELLEEVWLRYVDSLSFDENVPKNPIAEAARFCGFARNQLEENSLPERLLHYTQLKNQVIFDYGTEDKSYRSGSIGCPSGVNDKPIDVTFIVHPAARMESMPAGLLDAIRNRSPLDSSAIRCVDNPGDEETVLFYKNFQRGGLGTLKVSSPVEVLLSEFLRSPGRPLRDSFDQLGCSSHEAQGRLLEILKILEGRGVGVFCEVT